MQILNIQNIKEFNSDPVKLIQKIINDENIFIQIDQLLQFDQLTADLHKLLRMKYTCNQVVSAKYEVKDGVASNIANPRRVILDLTFDSDYWLQANKKYHHRYVTDNGIYLWMDY